MQIKMQCIDMKPKYGSTFYVDIDIFRFVKDEELTNPEVYIDDRGSYEFLTEIPILENDEAEPMGCIELKMIALDWIEENVQITGE